MIYSFWICDSLRERGLFLTWLPQGACGIVDVDWGGGDIAVFVGLETDGDGGAVTTGVGGGDEGGGVVTTTGVGEGLTSTAGGVDFADWGVGITTDDEEGKI